MQHIRVVKHSHTFLKIPLLFIIAINGNLNKMRQILKRQTKLEIKDFWGTSF